MNDAVVWVGNRDLDLELILELRWIVEPALDRHAALAIRLQLGVDVHSFKRNCGHIQQIHVAIKPAVEIEIAQV